MADGKVTVTLPPVTGAFLLKTPAAVPPVSRPGGPGRRPANNHAMIAGMSTTASTDCLFCKIIKRELASEIVFEDAISLAFLDHRPVFPGHTLLVPKQHLATFGDLPPETVAALFLNSQRLSNAMETGLHAEGAFVAVNNRVSQSIPHFHIHVVPRRKGDGLRGFFWPRHKYESEAAARQVAERLQAALSRDASKLA